MKRLLFALCLVTLACSTSTQLTAPAATLPQVTETAIPSATIDYAVTIAAGDMTKAQLQVERDAALRLMVDATAGAEIRTHEVAGWTEAAALRKYNDGLATGTAAATSIPLTQTNIAIVQTQVSQNGTAMVMTWSAPSQIVAMAEAQSRAEMAPYLVQGEVFMKYAAGVFFLSLAGLVVFLVTRQWRVIPQLAGVTDFTIKTGGAYPSSMTYTIPCTGAQMDELADGVIRKHKSLAHGQWEGRNSKTFTRESIEVMRRFMTAHKMAKNYPGHEVKITDYGEQVLRGWLDTRTLPRHLFLDLLSNDGTGNLSHKSEELPLEGEVA